MEETVVDPGAMYQFQVVATPNQGSDTISERLSISAQELAA
jgi:hypothetical protein